MRPPAPAQFLLGSANLAFSPALHRLLPEATQLVGQALLCIIGSPQIPARVLHRTQQGCNSQADLRVLMKSSLQFPRR